MSSFHEKFEQYYPYLEEIRRRIFVVFIWFLVLFVLGFFLTVPLFRLVKGYFLIKGASIVTTSPFQFIDLAMSTGMFIALVGTLPLLLYQIFSFLKTGLTTREKRKFLVYIPATLILFVFGFSYGFFTLYSTFDAIAQVNVGLGIQNYWDISKFLSQIFITSVLLGILFQFPLILSFLIKMDLFEVKFLRKKRRHAIVVIFVITSLLPPTDGVSLVVMVLPLIFLYEVTIFMNRRHKPESLQISLIDNE